MSDEPIINPSDTLRYLSKARKMTIEELRLPDLLLITYTSPEFEYAKKLIQTRPVKWWPWEGRLLLGKFKDRMIALSHSFVGAPGTVMMLEELIAHGAKRIIEAGLSGGIDPLLQPGDICIVTKALSDEGTSRHYYPKQRTFNPSPLLTRRISNTAKKSKLNTKESTVWTTDAVYRETRSKVKRFRSQGASLVNMESSAIFAIAKFRSVDAASIQVVSDIVVHDGWKPAFRHERVLENRQAMMRVAFKALASGQL